MNNFLFREERELFLLTMERGKYSAEIEKINSSIDKMVGQVSVLIQANQQLPDKDR